MNSQKERTSGDLVSSEFKTCNGKRLSFSHQQFLNQEVKVAETLSQINLIEDKENVNPSKILQNPSLQNRFDKLSLSPLKPKNTGELVKIDSAKKQNESFQVIQTKDAVSPLQPLDYSSKILGNKKFEDSLMLNKQRIANKKRTRQEFEHKNVTIFDTALDIEVQSIDTGLKDDGKWDFEQGKNGEIAQKAVKKVRFNPKNEKSDYNQMVNISATSSLLNMMPQTRAQLEIQLDKLKLTSEQRQVAIGAFERQKFKKDHQKWNKYYKNNVKIESSQTQVEQSTAPVTFTNTVSKLILKKQRRRSNSLGPSNLISLKKHVNDKGGLNKSFQSFTQDLM